MSKSLQTQSIRKNSVHKLLFGHAQISETQLLYGSEGSIMQLYHSQYYTTISSC